MSKLLSQGGFGCVYYPGIRCKNSKDDDDMNEYVTKLQRNNFNSQNEAAIGLRIQKNQHNNETNGRIRRLRRRVQSNYVTPAGKLKGEMQVYGEEKANYYKSKNNEVGNGATALHAAVENGHLEKLAVI